MKFVFLTAAIVFNAFANIFMKWGVTQKHVDITGIKNLVLSYVTNFYLMLGLLFFGIALLFYNKALEHFNLSVAYPLMTSCGLILVTIWSLFVFGEKLNIVQGIGLGCIITGIWLINYQY